MPKISIIVPVYNVEKYLSCCLDSIKAQTFTDWECILVDDGSSDKSGKICDEYANLDNRFVVIHQKNSGVSVARNRGIDIAKGEWITFVDSDDWIELETFDVVSKKGININTDIICYDMQKVYENGRKEVIPFRNISICKNFIKFPTYMNSLCNKVIRRDLFLDNHIFFNENIIVAEDLDVSFKLFTKAKSVYFLDTVFYNYRVNTDSVTRKDFSQKKIDDLWSVYSILCDYCFDKGIKRKYDKFLRYLNAVSVKNFLVQEKFYNPTLFREKSLPFNLWVYEKRFDLFFLYFFAFIHFDFVCKMCLCIYKLVKKRF